MSAYEAQQWKHAILNPFFRYPTAQLLPFTHEMKLVSPKLYFHCWNDSQRNN